MLTRALGLHGDLGPHNRGITARHFALEIPAPGPKDRLLENNQDIYEKEGRACVSDPSPICLPMSGF